MLKLKKFCSYVNRGIGLKFFHNAFDVAPLSSGLHCYPSEICCHSHLCSLVYNVSLFLWLFLRFFSLLALLVLSNLIIMSYIFFPTWILLNLFLWLYSFHQIWENVIHYFLKYFFCNPSHSCSSRTPITHTQKEGEIGIEVQQKSLSMNIPNQTTDAVPTFALALSYLILKFTIGT